jgi:hypothetical protein
MEWYEQEVGICATLLDTALTDIRLVLVDALVFLQVGDTVRALVSLVRRR